MKAEWLENVARPWGCSMFYCSNCKRMAKLTNKDGYIRQQKTNYCPTCGAKMKNPEDII